MVGFLTALAFGPAQVLGNGPLGNDYVDALARFVCAVLVIFMVVYGLGVGIARSPRLAFARARRALYLGA